jgi:hypothetical protein
VDLVILFEPSALLIVSSLKETCPIYISVRASWL